MPPYTLVAVPTLCLDLAARPAGAAVAGALRRALRLTAVDLGALAAEYRDDTDRQAAWDELEAACARESRAAAVPAGADAVRRSAALDLTPGATLEGLAGLLALIRAEVLGWTWQRAGDLRLQLAPQAVSVVCDAVAACYAGAAVSPVAFARLRQPWTTALRRIDAAASAEPIADEFGPGTPAVRRISARLSAARPVELAALAEALDQTRASGTSWQRRSAATAYAVELSGRLRPSAAAQLGVVRALPISAAGAAGTEVVTAATSAVQASVVADLLDLETYATMTRPWRVVFGRLD